MSKAVAVFHGEFGRVCLYDMDRAMVPHAHREGHLIFHVQGPPGQVVVDGTPFPLASGRAVAVSPLQAHFYRPLDARSSTLALVLYIRPGWFLNASRCATSSLRFGRAPIEVTDYLGRLVIGTARAMMDPDRDDPLLEDRVCSLTQACFDQSWQWTARRGSEFIDPALPSRDYRVRNALRLMQERLVEELELDDVARDVGLSRPHFYKLFRQQVGVTPNVFLNTLRMEQAITRLAATHEAVSDIGLDLGFSSQASFSRFFIANGVVAPSAYRRSVLTAAVH